MSKSKTTVRSRQKSQSKSIKSDKVKNLHHSDYIGKTEFAFEAGGVKYYNFKADTDVRYGRYVVTQAFMQEYYLRTSLESLQGNIKKLKGWLNPTISKDGSGKMDLGKSLELLEIMDQQAQIAFEPDTVFRLASCLYFDEHEVLTGYDRAYNEKKIESWKKHEAVDFFFHKLFQDVTGLTVSSKGALLNYLKTVPELLKGWRSMGDILSQ